MRGRWLLITVLPLIIAIVMIILTIRPVGATQTYSSANVGASTPKPAEDAPAPAAPTATPAPYPPTGPASTKGDGDGPPPIQAGSWNPQETFDVRHTPSLDASAIATILQHYNSPAAGSADTMYRLGLQYGIDPAYCLAFFIHESTAGTKGVAQVTKSVGNIRTTTGYRDYQGYRQYATWDEGIEDWYRLIRDLYIGQWNLTTVDQIVPVYAPASDNNDPDGYIRAIKQLVTDWRQGVY
ncbi:MAG: glucosaminidase domain-containing protein [Thermomicrobiales bacterium]|jgi:hypothetical protein